MTARPMFPSTNRAEYSPLQECLHEVPMPRGDFSGSVGPRCRGMHHQGTVGLVIAHVKVHLRRYLMAREGGVMSGNNAVSGSRAQMH